MDTLTALERMFLRNLPSLKLSFCNGASLPPNLQSFTVDSGRITKPVTVWGLHGLTALSSLNIGGDDIVNMFLKEQKMPISLVFLTIQYLSETKSLEGNRLRHLSSLEYLFFSECSELVSLPEKSLPSSLKTLYFYECPRLESLPEDSLPSSLELLRIVGCPLLEERYERKEHWSNIAHIPVIEINDQVTI
ncbi:LRR and NB-ARC domain disease resistance protein [Trifolium medium]|uniref:LRR and NB-ARC domain disease resistance protein n=1 Tax=Trifolium medium TaxID=97028 RepID=A0A392PA45_9FABA|nr:LRR and NB-ARC domain disease resistance protein [Trifolium medium]